MIGYNTLYSSDGSFPGGRSAYADSDLLYAYLHEKEDIGIVAVQCSATGMSPESTDIGLHSIRIEFTAGPETFRKILRPELIRIFSQMYPKLKDYTLSIKEVYTDYYRLWVY